MSEDAPASEQFDLQHGMAFDVTAEDVEELAAELEQAETIETENEGELWLAEFVAALKRLEDAAEEARKDVFEDELSDRVDEGDTVGDLRKTRGTSRYVTDDVAAIEAVREAGHDVHEVAKVSAKDLEQVLGEDADELIGESHYSYFRRQA